jgi:hypothetical protein
MGKQESWIIGHKSIQNLKNSVGYSNWITEKSRSFHDVNYCKHDSKNENYQVLYKAQLKCKGVSDLPFPMIGRTGGLLKY